MLILFIGGSKRIFRVRDERARTSKRSYFLSIKAFSFCVHPSPLSSFIRRFNFSSPNLYLARIIRRTYRISSVVHLKGIFSDVRCFYSSFFFFPSPCILLRVMGNGRFFIVLTLFVCFKFKSSNPLANRPLTPLKRSSRFIAVLNGFNRDDDDMTYITKKLVFRLRSIVHIIHPSSCTSYRIRTADVSSDDTMIMMVMTTTTMPCLKGVN